MSLSDDRLRDALRQLLLPAAERIAIAEAAIGSRIPPAFLDDDVMNELRWRGYTTMRGPITESSDIAVGAQISTRGDGDVYVVEISDAGRAFLAMGYA